LRHQYTCLYEVTQWGGTCIDPTFFHFPLDDNLQNDIQSSFIVGNSILVAPITQSVNGDTVSTYLPAGRWVDLTSGKFATVDSKNGENVNLDAKQTTVNAYLKPGSLIAW
jgi:alpha-glucosidase (family GH31 glycosyl hydrolase)